MPMQMLYGMSSALAICAGLVPISNVADQSAKPGAGPAFADTFAAPWMVLSLVSPRRRVFQFELRRNACNSPKDFTLWGLAPSVSPLKPVVVQKGGQSCAAKSVG